MSASFAPDGPPGALPTASIDRRHWPAVREFVVPSEAPVHVALPAPEFGLRLVQASGGRRVFSLPPHSARKWMLVVGLIVLCVALLGIAGAFGEHGGAFSLAACLFYGVCAAAFWLLRGWRDHREAWCVVSLTRERLDVVLFPRRGRRVATFPLDRACWAEMVVVGRHEVNDEEVITTQVVVHTADGEAGFGRHLSAAEQEWLVLRINEFLGAGYPEVCRACGHALTPAEVDAGTGELHCPDCHTVYQPSREIPAGSRLEVVEESPECLLFEVAGGGPKVKGIRDRTITWTFLTLCAVGALIYSLATPGVDREWRIFWGFVAAFTLLVEGKCVLTWRRKESGVTTLAVTRETATLLRESLGDDDPQEASLDAESRAGVAGLPGEPALEIVGHVQRLCLDEKLSLRETELWALRINEFLGRALWPARLEFPETCPDCHDALAASSISPGTGRLKCSHCNWQNDPLGLGKLPASPRELLQKLDGVRQVVQELAKTDIPVGTSFEGALRDRQREGTAAGSDERSLKQVAAALDLVRERTQPKWGPALDAVTLADDPRRCLEMHGGRVEDVSIRQIRVDIPNSAGLGRRRMSGVAALLFVSLLCSAWLCWWDGGWPGFGKLLLLVVGLASAGVALFGWLGGFRLDVDGDRLECRWSVLGLGYTRRLPLKELRRISRRGLLGMFEVLEFEGRGRAIRLAFPHQPLLTRALETLVRRQLHALHLDFHHDVADVPAK